jgi:hypothetical protein
MSRFISKERLQELVGGDITSIGGDFIATNDSQIQTGPVKKPYNDDSEYEKGMSTTTDKVFGRYRQDIPWFAVYSFGGSNTGGLALNYGSISKIGFNENTTVIKKKTVEEKIDDLVKRSKTSDVTDKNYNPKVAKLIDTISDVDLTDAQLEELSKAILDKKNNIKPIKNL